MTKEEAIKMLKSKMDGHTDTSYEWVETVRMAIQALEQEPCEDEYIKVPKKALKYRTAGMVAYNVEWLKNHFDIERAVILGCEYKEQEPCEDAISRADARHLIAETNRKALGCISTKAFKILYDGMDALPPVTPQPKTGHWIPISGRPPEDTGYYLTTTIYGDVYCDYWTGSRFDRQETVIAWMPLPQPYKAEGSENEK